MKNKIVIVVIGVLLLISVILCIFLLNNEKVTIILDDDKMNLVVNITTDVNGFGAGFFIKNNIIVTNYHVIDSSKEIKVLTYNKNEYLAKVVGYDLKKDIAVLQIEDEQNVSTVFADSIPLVDERIIAVGNPYGDLSFSKAEGKVVKLGDKLLDNIDSNREFIWYNGNPAIGFSGGPVFNSDGEIVGILSLAYMRNIGKDLGGIRPIEEVLSIANDIINRE